MSANKKIDDEKLSALMDGELDQQELNEAIDHLLNDSSAQVHWVNWHRISDGLHQRTLAPVSSEFQQSIRQKVAEEANYGHSASSNVVALGHISSRLTLPEWIPTRQLASMAIAASVTAVAILGFQQLHGPQVDAFQTATKTTAESETVARVASNAKPFELVAGDHLSLSSGEIDLELEPYLVNHQHLGGAATPVVSPYIRFVGHQVGNP